MLSTKENARLSVSANMANAICFVVFLAGNKSTWLVHKPCLLLSMGKIQSAFLGWIKKWLVQYKQSRNPLQGSNYQHFSHKPRYLTTMPQSTNNENALQLFLYNFKITQSHCTLCKVGKCLQGKAFRSLISVWSASCRMFPHTSISHTGEMIVPPTETQP